MVSSARPAVAAAARAGRTLLTAPTHRRSITGTTRPMSSAPMRMSASASATRSAPVGGPLRAYGNAYDIRAAAQVGGPSGKYASEEWTRLTQAHAPHENNLGNRTENEELRRDGHGARR